VGHLLVWIPGQELVCSPSSVPEMNEVLELIDTKRPFRNLAPHPPQPPIGPGIVFEEGSVMTGVHEWQKERKRPRVVVAVIFGLLEFGSLAARGDVC